MSLQEQDEAIEEIASSLNIPKKYIHYDFTDTPYFVIQDRNYQGNNRLEDEDRLYIEDFDFKLLKKYTLFFIECDIYVYFCPTCIDVDTPHAFRFDGCVFYDSIVFDYLYLSIQSFIARHCHFLGDVDICFPFENDSCFEYCYFEGWVNFTNAIFKKDISFYGSTFNRCPNFSKTRFGGNINIINTNLDFDFFQTEEVIVSKWMEDSIDLDIKTHLSFVANDFRDSFRIFKNTLSKEGNLLDASNYHRVELYCKEIELDSKNPPILSREWIDRWQLFFYRHTSDHHTDLLKIISWVIIAIGIFGFGFFIVKYYQDVSILSYLSPYGVALSLAGMVCLGIFWVMGYIKKLFLFAGVGLISTLWIACYKPTLIFGAINLIDKTSRSGLENFILVLYTLVMILLLFSLQKTARKNSIVPS
nr:pentapeptide repeat-containing protein [Helicobacter kayseriensis]